MAEDPHSWDVLVSSLAVWDINTDARRAWAFLVVQNLVRDDTEDRNGFLTIVQEEIGCGPITGPTVALRVAARLHAIGVAVRSSDYPDPVARIAKARLDTILQWCRQRPDFAPSNVARTPGIVTFRSALSRAIRSWRRS